MTLQALDSILNQQFLSKDIEMDVCLVDDGSIDGTSSLVREKFPNVLILQGSGNLFFGQEECVLVGINMSKINILIIY